VKFLGTSFIHLCLSTVLEDLKELSPPFQHPADREGGVYPRPLRAPTGNPRRGLKKSAFVRIWPATMASGENIELMGLPGGVASCPNIPRRPE
jgi:hypothetical protein